MRPPLPGRRQPPPASGAPSTAKMARRAEAPLRRRLARSVWLPGSAARLRGRRRDPRLSARVQSAFARWAARPRAPTSTGDYMILDGQTRRNLELVRSGRAARGGRGLLGVLDRTCTARAGACCAAGSASRCSISRRSRRGTTPSRSSSSAPAARDGSAAAILKRIGDLERLTGRTVAGTSSPRDLHNLRPTLGMCRNCAPRWTRSRPRLSPLCANDSTPAPRSPRLSSGPSPVPNEGRRIRPATTPNSTA